MRGFARRQVELRGGDDHADARRAVAIGGDQTEGVAGLRKRHVSGEEEKEDPGTHRRRCHYTPHSWVGQAVSPAGPRRTPIFPAPYPPGFAGIFVGFRAAYASL